VITLTKPNQTATINLKKTSDTNEIRVSTFWKGAGDLDLRAALLLPNGEMHFLDCNYYGSKDSKPYAKHLGDILNTNSGEEVIVVNKDIAKHFGGEVHIVFSVYSAISNGDISIEQLAPSLKIEGAGDDVACDFYTKGNSGSCYTYTLAVVSFKEDSLTVTSQQLLSPRSSENTPWITLTKEGPTVAYTGNPIFKKGNRSVQQFDNGQNFISKALFGERKRRNQYANVS
tara:strand:+ start:169 stop:855 length:687 start_codon:yes stop_codon:yes gene_type:complete